MIAMSSIRLLMLSLGPPGVHVIYGIDKGLNNVVEGLEHGHPQLIAGFMNVRVKCAHQRGAHLYAFLPSPSQDGHQLGPHLLKQVPVILQQNRVLQRVRDVQRVAVPRNRHLDVPQLWKAGGQNREQPTQRPGAEGVPQKL